MFDIITSSIILTSVFAFSLMSFILWSLVVNNKGKYVAGVLVLVGCAVGAMGVMSYKSTPIVPMADNQNVEIVQAGL